MGSSSLGVTDSYFNQLLEAEPICESAAPVLGEWLDMQSHIAACHMQVPGSGHSKAVEV